MKEIPQVTVYLVRHGESVGKDSPRRQIPTDGLSESGHVQAELLSRNFPHVDTVRVSTYQRAIETAEYINGKVQVIEGIGERKEDPRLEGVLRESSVNQQYLQEIIQGRYDIDHRFLNGESSRELLERGQAFVEEMGKWDVGSHAVISHQMFLKATLAYILAGGNETSWILSIGNTGVSSVTFNKESEKWNVGIINNMSHLWK